MEYLEIFKMFAGLFSPATWFLLIAFLVMVSAITRAHLNPKSRLDWEDLLLDEHTFKMSLIKLGQMIGIIVSTWVVIDIVDTKHSIGVEILLAYLAFLLGGYGISTFYKSMINDPDPNPRPRIQRKSSVVSDKPDEDVK